MEVKMIKVNNQEHLNVLSICKKDKQGIRVFMDHAHVEDGILYATNGKSLLYCPTYLDEGNYRVIKSIKKFAEIEKVTGDFSYPNVQRVIPSNHQAEIHVDFTYEIIKWKTLKTLYLALLDGYTLNLDLLKPLFGYSYQCYISVNSIKLVETNRKISAVISTIK